MKILFVCNEYPPAPSGGIGIFVKNLSEQLLKHNIQPIVIGVYPIQRDLVETINDVTVYRFAEQKLISSHFKLGRILNNIYSKYLLSKKVAAIEKNEDIDMIESYEWNGPLFSKPKSKLIIRLHGGNTPHAEAEGVQRNSFIAFWEKRNLRMADLIVPVSEHILKITQKSFGTMKVPFKKIYNSINDSLFCINEKVQRDKNLVLFVGKFHARKGVFELFQIIEILMNLNENYRFVFIGNHTEENKAQLMKSISTIYSSRIEFINQVSQTELPAFYQRANLMIMPTLAEAFGLTTIEAMACGCVVAMNDIPVAREIIEDDRDGIIIDVKNFEESANKINKLLNNDSKIEQLRMNAIRRVNENFSNKVVTQQNVEMYKSLNHEN